MHSSSVGLAVGLLVPALFACVLLAFLIYRKRERQRIEEDSHKDKINGAEYQHETFETDEPKRKEEYNGVQVEESQLETHGEDFLLPLVPPLGERIEEHDVEDKIDERQSILTSFEQSVTLVGEQKQIGSDMQALCTEKTEMTQQHVEHEPVTDQLPLASSTGDDTEYQPESTAQTQDQLADDYIQKETEAVPELGDIRIEQLPEIPRTTESVLDSEETDNLLTSLGVQEMLFGDTESNKVIKKKKKKKKSKEKEEEGKCPSVSDQGSPVKTEKELEGDQDQPRVETEMSEDTDHITEHQAEVGKKRKPRKKGKRRTSREDDGKDSKILEKNKSGEEGFEMIAEIEPPMSDDTTQKKRKVEKRPFDDMGESPLNNESELKDVVQECILADDLITSKDSEHDIVMLEKKKKHRKKKRKSVDKGSTSTDHNKVDSPDHSEKNKPADKSPKSAEDEVQKEVYSQFAKVHKKKKVREHRIDKDIADGDDVT